MTKEPRELCTRECNETEKKTSFEKIECSSGKIGRKRTFVKCSPFPQKVAENGVRTQRKAAKKLTDTSAIWRAI